MEEEATCSICLNALTGDRKPVATVCGHVFCFECIRRWVNGKQTPTCPQCKTELTDGDDFTKIDCGGRDSFDVVGPDGAAHGGEGSGIGGPDIVCDNGQDYIMQDGESGGRYKGRVFRCRRCGKCPAPLPVVREDTGLVYCWACATFDAINNLSLNFWPLYIHTDSDVTNDRHQGSTYSTLLPTRPRPLTHLERCGELDDLSSETSLEDDSVPAIQRPSGPPVLPNYEPSSFIALRLLERGCHRLSWDRACPSRFRTFPREHLRYPRIGLPAATRRYKDKHSLPCSSKSRSAFRPYRR